MIRWRGWHEEFGNRTKGGCHELLVPSFRGLAGEVVKLDAL
jgi:hypothetical protein